jgi:galactonate dehydratase
VTATKITDVEVYVVDPTQGAATYNEEPQNVWTFVRVLTDAGVHGWGESSNFPANGSLIIGDAIRRLRPWIVGQDAADITAMWHRLFRKAAYLGPRGLPTAVVSGIDIALWDIKGRLAGRPVHDLLGGKVRDSVPLYANGWFAALDGHPACATPEEYAAAARRVVGRGHAAIKLDPFHEMVPHHTGYLGGQITAAGEEFGVACVAAIREAIAPGVEVLIDAHGQYNVPTAVRLARRLERYRIGWFEEPTPPESLDALRAVREQVAVPITVGERLYTRWDFLPVLAERLADYLMPDVVWTGGISEVMRIAALAETYHVPVTPHNAMGPLQVVAGAHAMLTVPNFYRLEHNVANVPWYDRCLDRTLDLRGDQLHLSARPGLGVELDPAFLRAHAARGWTG